MKALKYISIAGFTVAFFTILFWYPLYYGIISPLYASQKLGVDTLYPWMIDKKHIDISRDGTNSYWYFYRDYSVPSGKCIEDTVSMHLGPTDNARISACVIKKISLLNENCSTRTIALLQIKNKRYAVLISEIVPPPPYDTKARKC